jgi:hypothetical protein
MADPSTSLADDPRFSWEPVEQSPNGIATDQRFGWQPVAQPAQDLSMDPRLGWDVVDKAFNVDPAVIEQVKKRLADARARASVADRSGIPSSLANEYGRGLLSQRDSVALAKGGADSLTQAGGGIAGIPFAAANYATELATGERSEFLDQISGNLQESTRSLASSGPGPGEDASYMVGRIGVPMVQALSTGGFAGIPAMVGLGTVQGGGIGFTDAANFGATNNEALAAGGLEAVLGGATSAVPLLKSGAGKPLAKYLGDVGIRTGIEALQGGLYRGGVNAIRKGVYNPDQELSEGVVEAMIISGAIRGTLEAPGVIARGAGAIGDAHAQRAADRVDTDALGARVAADEAAKVAEQAQRDGIEQMIARQYESLTVDPKGTVEGPPTTPAKPLTPEQKARLDTENATRTLGGGKPMTVAEFRESGIGAGPKPPAPPKPVADLTPEQKARFDRDNTIRVIGGERPLTQEEFRARGVEEISQPKSNMRMVDGVVEGGVPQGKVTPEPTMRMNEGGVVERVAPAGNQSTLPKEHADFLARDNKLRESMGERPRTEAEYRELLARRGEDIDGEGPAPTGAKTPKPKPKPSPATPKLANPVESSTMRMTEGGVVERVQPEAPEVAPQAKVTPEAEAPVRQVEDTAQRGGEGLDAGEVRRSGGVVKKQPWEMTWYRGHKENQPLGQTETFIASNPEQSQGFASQAGGVVSEVRFAREPKIYPNPIPWDEYHQSWRNSKLLSGYDAVRVIEPNGQHESLAVRNPDILEFSPKATTSDADLAPAKPVDPATVRNNPESVPVTPKQQKNGGGVSKALRKFHKDEGGSVSFSQMGDAVATAATAVSRVLSPASHKIDYFSRFMKDRVNRAKTESGRVVSSIMADIDVKVGRTTGAFKADMQEIAKEVSLVGSPTQGSKLDRLRSTPQRVARNSELVTPKFGGDKTWAISKVAADLGDRNVAATGVTAAMAKMEAKMAKFLQGKGLLQSKNGDAVEFVGAEDGRVFVRFWTRDMLNVVAAGPAKSNPAYKQVVDAYIDANAGKVNPTVIEKMFRDLHDAMSKTNPDGETVHRINQEIARVIPVAPTHIKIKRPTGGTFILNALEVDPVRYSARLIDRVAKKVAWIDNFGQPQLGKPGKYNLDELRQKFTNDGNDTFLFNEFEAIGNGIPMDMIDGNLVRALTGTAGKRVAAMTYLHETLSTVKTSMMTGTMPLNIPETIAGGPSVYIGTREMMAAMGLRKGIYTKADMDFATSFVDLETAQRYDVSSFAIDRSKRFGIPDTLQEARDVTMTLFGVKPINELQDRLTPVAAALKTRSWQRGVKDPQDYAVLRSMGFEAKTARDMVAGKGSADDYTRFIQDSPSHLVGSTPGPFSRSRADYNRTFKALIAFSTYARRRFDQTKRTFELLGEGMAKKDTELLKSAGVLMLRQTGGGAAQGAMMYFIGALLYGGAEGVYQAVRDVKHDPVGAGVDFIQNALIGGPYMQLAEMFSSSLDDESTEGLITKGVTSTFPGTVTKEVLDMVKSQGIYRDQEWSDKAHTYFTRRIPGNRMLNNFVAAMGLTERDRKMEMAVSNFYKWKRENDMPSSRTVRQNEPEEGPKFRQAMREARTELERGGDPAQAFGKALGLRSASSVRMSLRGNKTLNDLNGEQLESLRKRIGDVQFEKLQTRDALLEAWAENILDF